MKPIVHRMRRKAAPTSPPLLVKEVCDMESNFRGLNLLFLSQKEEDGGTQSALFVRETVVDTTVWVFWGEGVGVANKDALEIGT